MQRYAFKNLLLSLKDLLTYGKLLEERDNKTQQMERKIQHEEENNKVVKKMLGKNCDKSSKRNGCSQLASDKVCFCCGGDFPYNRECPATGKNCHKCDKVEHFSRFCRSKQKMCKGAEAVNSMATPDSADSESDIDLATLKGLFTVTKKS